MYHRPFQLIPSLHSIGPRSAHVRRVPLSTPYSLHTCCRSPARLVLSLYLFAQRLLLKRCCLMLLSYVPEFPSPIPRCIFTASRLPGLTIHGSVVSAPRQYILSCHMSSQSCRVWFLKRSNAIHTVTGVGTNKGRPRLRCRRKDGMKKSRVVVSATRAAA